MGSVGARPAPAGRWRARAARLTALGALMALPGALGAAQTQVFPSITAPAPAPTPAPASAPAPAAPVAPSTPPGSWTPATSASAPVPATSSGAGELVLEGQVLMEAASGSAKVALDALPYVAHGRGKQIYFEAGQVAGALQPSAPGTWQGRSDNSERYRLTLGEPPKDRQTGYALPVPAGCATRYEHDGRAAPVSVLHGWISGGALGSALVPLRLGRLGEQGSAMLAYAWSPALISQVVACPATATRSAVVLGAWLELKAGWNLIVTSSEAGEKAQTIKVTSVPVAGQLSMDLIPADH